MDDLELILGIKYSPEQQAALKELERRSNDRFRVYNPTTEDYFVLWDITNAGGRFLIPSNTRDIGYGAGQAVHPRYIAFKFFKEISTKILMAEMVLAIKEENERRKAAGMPTMDKTLERGEELAFAQAHLPNDPKKLMELLPKIILGIEQEWGMDTLPYQKSEDTVKWEKVMALVNRPVGSPVPSTDIQPRIVNDPLPDLRDPLEVAEQVANTIDNDPLKGVSL